MRIVKALVRGIAGLVVLGAVVLSIVVSIDKGYWWLPILFYIGCPLAIVLLGWALSDKGEKR